MKQSTSVIRRKLGVGEAGEAEPGEKDEGSGGQCGQYGTVGVRIIIHLNLLIYKMSVNTELNYKNVCILFVDIDVTSAGK